RPFIIQSAKGDATVPNPTASAIVRAGDAHDRWTLFRNDLVLLARPGAPANPHTFLTNIGNSTVADLAIAAQHQIGFFFASDGAVVVDPGHRRRSLVRGANRQGPDPADGRSELLACWLGPILGKSLLLARASG